MKAFKLKWPEYASQRWHNVKQSAKKRGYEFTLTSADVERLRSMPCAYGAGSLVATTHRGIDRKDNAVGYIFENCVPCCYRHNFIKGRFFTYEQMLEIVKSHPLLANCGDSDIDYRRHASGRKTLVT
jgi:hypothetical protein